MKNLFFVLLVFTAGMATGGMIQKSSSVDTWKEELAKEEGWNKGWEAGERTCLANR